MDPSKVSKLFADAPGPWKRRPIERDSATEARDKWIYGQAIRLVPWDSICRKLQKKLQEKGCKKWEPIGTGNGCKERAMAYAERHRLPAPALRKAGRPPKK
jgi:hypothetical protein